MWKRDNVLELCCFEWFQNEKSLENLAFASFRAVLFRMVPKQKGKTFAGEVRFRAVLFRMVPKLSLGLDQLKQVLELCCFEWFQN